jgi:hypothetical protein
MRIVWTTEIECLRFPHESCGTVTAFNTAGKEIYVA